MAACVGMPHPKWDERPIVAVVKRPGAEVTRRTAGVTRRQDGQMADPR